MIVRQTPLDCSGIVIRAPASSHPLPRHAIRYFEEYECRLGQPQLAQGAAQVLRLDPVGRIAIENEAASEIRLLEILEHELVQRLIGQQFATRCLRLEAAAVFRLLAITLAHDLGGRKEGDVVALLEELSLRRLARARGTEQDDHQPFAGPLRPGSDGNDSHRERADPLSSRHPPTLPRR